MSNESNPVSLLQEHCTRQRYICKYLFKREVPDHAPLYHASVDVDGLLFDADTPAPTKAAAKRLAALSALNYLQQNIKEKSYTLSVVQEHPHSVECRVVGGVPGGVVRLSGDLANGLRKGDCFELKF